MRLSVSIFSLFGVLSGIVKDNISVHHIVISRLESHYEVELNAAVSTAYDLASISKYVGMVFYIFFQEHLP